MQSDAQPQVGDETGESRFDRLTAIPEKNANWALFFPPIWLTYHGLWFALMVYGLVMILLFGLLSTPLISISLLLLGLPGLYLWFEGNQLRRNKLEAQGSELVDVVYAPNERAALERYLSNWQPKEHPKTSISQRPVTIDSAPNFGMFPQGEM